MRSVRAAAVPGLSLACLLGAWYALAAALGTWKLPHPVRVLASFESLGSSMLVDAAYSLYHLTLGLSASIVVGALAGAAIGLIPGR